MRDTRPLTEMSNEELWQLFPVILQDYDPAWQEAYAREAALLRGALANHLVRIHHVGSTAVPGLRAKPTVDILAEVTPESAPKQLDRILEDAGYLTSPQPDRPPPHRMYMKGYTPRGFEGQAYHLHLRLPGDPDECYFRDWLRAHPQAAAAYAAIKEELAGRYPHDRDAYTAAKGGFVAECTALARAAWPGKHPYRPLGSGEGPG